MLTRERFDEQFQPRPSPSGEELWTWEEIVSRASAPVTRVWTVVTGDDNESEYAIPGFRIVNRVGYVVTTHPWRDDTEDAVWYERD